MITPSVAVAVPCCGSGTARVSVSGSPSGSKQTAEVGSAVGRFLTTLRGKPEFELHCGA